MRFRLFDIFCPLRHAAQTGIPLAMLQSEMSPSKDCLVWVRPHGVTQMDVGPTEGYKKRAFYNQLSIVGAAINLMLAETLPGGK